MMTNDGRKLQKVSASITILRNHDKIRTRYQGGIRTVYPTGIRGTRPTDSDTDGFF